MPINEKQTRLGDFIRSRREEMEMSITDLAAETPVTTSTISSIESGEIETPSLPVLEAIAAALDVAMSRLIDLLSEGAMPADEVAANSIAKGIIDPYVSVVSALLKEIKQKVFVFSERIDKLEKHG